MSKHTFPRRRPLVGATLMLLSLPLAAETLPGVVEQLLTDSHRAAAARYDAAVSEAKVTESVRRAWTPNIDITAESGQQRYDKEGVSSKITNENYDRFTLRLTQKVADFGRSAAEIAEARSVAAQSATVADSTAEGVLLDALSAHWSVVRSRKALRYAEESEAKVRNQTALESSMVELGRGYESNVLQSKVQLATAEARRNRAEGALQIANARIEAVFGNLAGSVDYNQVAQPKAGLIPASLAAAKELALQHNRQIQVGVHRSSAIQQRIARVNSQAFRPNLQLVGEYGLRHDIDGQEDRIDDRKVMLQLQYAFNTGMAGSYAVTAAKQEFNASTQREQETRAQVLEQVTIAWRNLAVARNNRNVLRNQVNIASNYLDMATAERQNGRRSLLDVLSAEMSLINAQSDLATTEADEAIAALTLLQAIGMLNLENISFVDAR